MAFAKVFASCVGILLGGKWDPDVTFIFEIGYVIQWCDCLLLGWCRVIDGPQQVVESSLCLPVEGVIILHVVDCVFS